MEHGHREALLVEFPLERAKVHLFSEVVDRISYDISDPAEANVDLKQVAHQLYDLVKRGYPAICQLADPA